MRELLIGFMCLLLLGTGCANRDSRPIGDFGESTMKAEPATVESPRRVPLDDTALAKVAADGIEVTWDDVKGLCTLLAARVPVQVCHLPRRVLVHPDMSVTLATAGISLYRDIPPPPVIGLAIGKPGGFPDMFKVTRRLHRGYMPIVNSQWVHDNLRLRQTVFCYLPHDRRVKTGRETQYVMMRLTVTNNDTCARQAPLFLYLGRGGDSYVNYLPFNPVAARWAQPPMPLTLDGSVLSSKTAVKLVYRSDKPVAAAFVPGTAAKAGRDKPPALNNALRFDIHLAGGETRTLDFVIADSDKGLPPAEVSAMKKVRFDKALRQASERSEALLAPAMKLTTPDPRINEIYKHLALSNLSLQFRDPKNGWQVPNQSPTPGVWSWEFAHMAVPMISIGLHEELDDSLKFFIDRQNGVGPKNAKSPPQGNIKTTRGSFVGDNGGRLWMNETGSILWALAARFRYTHDTKWLKANWPSILAAWGWIQTERQATRITDKNGQKVRYWGLLPSGMPGDIQLYSYTYTFNDSFTYLGMSEIAAAAREARLPEAKCLTKEAEEYRRCILDVVHREEFIDPKTKLLFVPNTVLYRETPPDKRDPYWVADGPIQLFDTGVLHPTDKRFADMVEFTRITKSLPYSGILLGFAEHMGGADWYPNQTERSYFRCYLGRGEIEKALLVLYSNLNYGMSNDTYQTSERFKADNSNWTGLSPNASGNGRNIDMIRRMVIDEQDSGKLWLLRGCPRRWFEPGKSIVAENAPTVFGKMAIRTKSMSDRIVIDVKAPDRKMPESMILMVRHPKERTIRKVTVNGKPAKIDGEAIVLPQRSGKFHVVVRLAKHAK